MRAKLYVIAISAAFLRDAPHVSRRVAAPDGLLRRPIAIDVPGACVAGFEKFFVIAFKIGRSLSNIVFVTRRMRGARCEAAGPEKPEVYSLEYIEDFFGPRTTQMAANRSP